MKKKILLFVFTLVITITGIVNTNAIDKYDGDYTIEYLLRNYNVVTLGTKDKHEYSVMTNYDTTRGSVSNIFDIGGPVLIRGNYVGSASYDNEFAQKTNGIPSYIKGTLFNNVNPGSIESSDISDIYVGTSNYVSKNGDKYLVNSYQYQYSYPVYKSDDYLDFDKLYAAIVNEQASIEDGTPLLINDPILLSKYGHSYSSSIVIIEEPGIYTIEDISRVSRIYIYNYNSNEPYIINNKSEMVYSFPLIDIKYGNNNFWVKQDKDVVYCGREGMSQPCISNVVWNFPNARYLYPSYQTFGHIVAPKADVELVESNYPGTIIANSIVSEENSHTAIQFFPYTSTTTFTEIGGATSVVEEKDIDSDQYDGNYSLDELLKNYSIVSLGQKDYEEGTKLSEYSDKNGSVNIFHTSGLFLINGDLGVDEVVYGKQTDKDIKGMRLDFRHTEPYLNAYIKGDLQSDAYDNSLYVWDLRLNSKYSVLVAGSGNTINTIDDKRNLVNGIYTFGTPKNTSINDNYINFKVLYDSIVEQQKEIDKGTTVTKNEYNRINIPIGGNYTIDSLEDVVQITFDNFPQNKDKLTIITINDSGSVYLPEVGNGSNVYTNDWYGKTTRTYTDEILRDEIYYGNIVWNIPNATYVKLPEKAPFIGHVIAPNADVETDETHFAGAMIVNSLYSEGHSEAHFYPLTVGTVGDGIEPEPITIGDPEPDKISINGTKTWDDNDNQDGIRPESVTINLLANGEKVDSVAVTADSNWEYEFKDVPRTKDGKKITYTITEDAVDNYSTVIDGYNITNSYTPEKTSLTVNKVWNDEDNKDGIRPSSVEIQLYANGEKLGDPVELSEENNWTYIFNELDMKSSGKKIEYTVKEITEIDGYTIEITGNQEEGYTITNTHIVKEEVKEDIDDNPTTLDNITKFTVISIVSSIVLVIGVILFNRLRRREV